MAAFRRRQPIVWDVWFEDDAAELIGKLGDDDALSDGIRMAILGAEEAATQQLPIEFAVGVAMLSPVVWNGITELGWTHETTDDMGEALLWAARTYRLYEHILPRWPFDDEEVLRVLMHGCTTLSSFPVDLWSILRDHSCQDLLARMEELAVPSVRIAIRVFLVVQRYVTVESALTGISHSDIIRHCDVYSVPISTEVLEWLTNNTDASREVVDMLLQYKVIDTDVWVNRMFSTGDIGHIMELMRYLKERKINLRNFLKQNLSLLDHRGKEFKSLVTQHVTRLINPPA